MRHYGKALRSRSVGAIMVIVVLAATLLATLVVGASAANTKANHAKRVNHPQTTAHQLRSQGGGTLPGLTG